MNISPDIIAIVELYPTEEGGRNSPTPPHQFRCIFVLGDENYDCLLSLGKTGALYPGHTYEIPIKFLRPDLIVESLTVGRKFYLRDLRLIAEGEVTAIVKQ